MRRLLKELYEDAKKHTTKDPASKGLLYVTNFVSRFSIY